MLKNIDKSFLITLPELLRLLRIRHAESLIGLHRFPLTSRLCDELQFMIFMLVWIQAGLFYGFIH